MNKQNLKDTITNMIQNPSEEDLNLYESCKESLATEYNELLFLFNDNKAIGITESGEFFECTTQFEYFVFEESVLQKVMQPINLTPEEKEKLSFMLYLNDKFSKYSIYIVKISNDDNILIYIKNKSVYINLLMDDFTMLSNQHIHDIMEMNLTINNPITPHNLKIDSSTNNITLLS